MTAVSAVYKEPDIHIYDKSKEIEFAMIRYKEDYIAKWNHDLFNRDQFKENGTIHFSIENLYFFNNQSWIDRKTFQGSQEPFFQVLSSSDEIDDDIANGNVTFKQNINVRRGSKFQFDLSVVVLVKKTRHLTINYTSTLFSFVPRLFDTTAASQLGYCDLWLKRTNEAISTTDLQSCPCNVKSVQLDPDYIPDPTCSVSESKCHENLMANQCFIKNIQKM